MIYVGKYSKNFTLELFIISNTDFTHVKLSIYIGYSEKMIPNILRICPVSIAVVISIKLRLDKTNKQQNIPMNDLIFFLPRRERF